MKNGLFKDLLKGKRYPTDLIITIVFSILSVVIALFLPDGSILRIIFGVPMLLFFPGYALVSVMWPGKFQPMTGPEGSDTTRKGIDNMERVVFSIGLSLVLIPIIGLILNYVSSITLVPILVSLLIITLFCSFLAIYLRKSLSRTERFYVSFILKSDASGDGLFPVILVSCIVIIASVLVFMITNPPDNSQYTEFYLLDQNHMLNNLPNNLTVNQTGTVLITIHSHENELVNYTIIAGVENSTLSTTYLEASSQIELSMTDYTATNISLNNSAMHEQEYTFHFSTPGNYRVVWNLLIDGQETEYQLHVLVSVS